MFEGVFMFGKCSIGLFLFLSVLFAPACSTPGLSAQQLAAGPADRSFSLYHGGQRRKYIVHFPPAFRRAKKLPVVMALHGGGGNAARSRALYHLDSFADQRGFLTVYPEGTGRRIAGQVVGTWNAGRCCNRGKKRPADDVGFISDLTDHLIKKFKADPKRIFVTGHSNGAQMAYRLACELSGKIAAVAPTGAQGVFTRCPSRRPVPILHIHGTLDPCALYQGGLCGGCLEKYFSAAYQIQMEPALWLCESVPRHIEWWRRRYRLTGPAQVSYSQGATTCVTFQSAGRGADVALCTISGHGHALPNGEYGGPCIGGDAERCALYQSILGPDTSDIDFPDMIWKFFEGHPMK